MAIASDRELFNAVIAALTAAGLTVGDAVTPTSAPPYVIAYPMPSGGTSGPMSAVHDDEDYVVQLTSVGLTREMAQRTADTAKVRLLSGNVTIPNRSLMAQVRMDVGAGVMRDDDTADGPLFVAHHRYRLQTTPA